MPTTTLISPVHPVYYRMSTMLVLAAGAAPAFFTEVAALLVASALIAYVCYRLGIVPIVGFLVAGVVIGPMGLGLVSDPELVNQAAEVGVILLLFTIGIEFSLEKLARIQRLIFGGGGLQVLLATLATMAILIPFGVSWQAALFTGFLVALSSTAIVLKLLGDRGEMAEPHAQASVGLLIFQDLAIIVMVLMTPMLAGSGGSSLSILWALSKALLIIVIVLVLARRVMPLFLEAVARTCSAELFLLTVIGICFGTAYLTSLAGVSLSLGAFLAGLIVSESRFSEHAMGEIMPLQILFSATFFVSVGMLLDLGFLVANLPIVLGAVLVVVLIKVVTTSVAIRALGNPLSVAAGAGFVLAQIGEFSFVLARTGSEAGLYPAGIAGTGEQVFIASTVLVMVLTPLLVGVSKVVRGRLAEASSAVPGSTDEQGDVEVHGSLPNLEGHVIVAGYGVAAKRLVRVMRRVDVPFVVLTLSPEGANEAEREGIPVLRGDYVRRHVLEKAGIYRARTLIIADDDLSVAHRVVNVARELARELHIVVRTRYMSEIKVLHEEGVDCVIAEELESIVQLFARLLTHHGVEQSEVETLVEEIRGADYAGLLGDSESDQDGSSLIVTLETDTDSGTCSHLDQIRSVVPSSTVCDECVEAGDTWIHLRICMTCGHVGCCDSSKNKHARRHFEETGHPIMRSMEAGETWGWCYIDKRMLK